MCAGSYQPVNMPLSCDPVKENYISKEWFGQSKLALILMAKYVAKLTKGDLNLNRYFFRKNINI